MNLFEELVKSAPVGNRLQFGIAENVFVAAIDTGVRKTKGLPIKQNTFIKLCTVDPETSKITAQSEGSYWNLDHKSEFVVSNFLEQMTSLAAIIDAVNSDEDAVTNYDDDIMAALPEGKADNVDSFLATEDGATAMQQALLDAADKYIKPFVGVNCPPLKCKITTNKKGYFELGKELNWILPMSSEEKLATITAVERRMYRESLKADTTKQAKPDSTGEKKVASASTFKGL